MDSETLTINTASKTTTQLPVSQSEPKLNFDLNQTVFNNSNSNGSAIREAEGQEENKEYPCLFCSRKFRTAQALGGHQNAHTKERSALREARLPNYHMRPIILMRYPDGRRIGLTHSAPRPFMTYEFGRSGLGRYLPLTKRQIFGFTESKKIGEPRFPEPITRGAFGLPKLINGKYYGFVEDEAFTQQRRHRRIGRDVDGRGSYVEDGKRGGGGIEKPEDCKVQLPEKLDLSLHL